jgi:hypothetical protein
MELRIMEDSSIVVVLFGEFALFLFIPALGSNRNWLEEDGKQTT